MQMHHNPKQRYTQESRTHPTRQRTTATRLQQYLTNADGKSHISRLSLCTPRNGSKRPPTRPRWRPLQPFPDAGTQMASRTRRGRSLRTPHTPFPGCTPAPAMAAADALHADDALRRRYLPCMAVQTATTRGRYKRRCRGWLGARVAFPTSPRRDIPLSSVSRQETTLDVPRPARGSCCFTSSDQTLNQRQRQATQAIHEQLEALRGEPLDGGPTRPHPHTAPSSRIKPQHRPAARGQRTSAFGR
jgi:hypothetical protein